MGIRTGVLALCMVVAVVCGAQCVAGAEEAGYGGDILYTKPVKSVIFSHKNHVEELGLSCNLCHDKLFQMDALNAQKNADFTMKALYAGKYCGACHDGKMAFASNTQCARCHIGSKGFNKLQKAGKT